MLVAAAACGDPATAIDAASADAPTDAPADASDDAPTDAPAIDACTTRVLFTGGADPAAQGWTVVQSGAAELTASGPTDTRLRTQTVGTAGAHLLLSLPAAVTPGAPFTVDVELQVVAVAPHNQFDAAVAILGSFTPPFATAAQRPQMIYIDADAVGWADDSGRAPVNNLDGAFHTYRLAVDAAGTATVSRDGQPLLTRAGFVTNGTLAIGDQTNDPNVESTILVRSVSLLCP